MLWRPAESAEPPNAVPKRWPEAESTEAQALKRLTPEPGALHGYQYYSVGSPTVIINIV